MSSYRKPEHYYIDLNKRINDYKDKLNKVQQNFNNLKYDTRVIRLKIEHYEKLLGEIVNPIAFIAIINSDDHVDFSNVYAQNVKLYNSILKFINELAEGPSTKFWEMDSDCSTSNDKRLATKDQWNTPKVEPAYQW